MSVWSLLSLLQDEVVSYGGIADFFFKFGILQCTNLVYINEPFVSAIVVCLIYLLEKTHLYHTLA